MKSSFTTDGPVVRPRQRLGRHERFDSSRQSANCGAATVGQDLSWQVIAATVGQDLSWRVIAVTVGQDLSWQVIAATVGQDLSWQVIGSLAANLPGQVLAYVLLRSWLRSSADFDQLGTTEGHRFV